MYRMYRDWIDAGKIIETSGGEKKIAAARQQLRDSLIASDDLFGLTPFLLHDELSLADCALVPLLWRLPAYDINLTAKQAPKVNQYMDRMFRRDSFQRSLTEVERLVRESD